MILIILLGNFIACKIFNFSFKIFFGAYLFYLFLTLIIFVENFVKYPLWFGTTGPWGNGFGTDDSRYLAAISDTNSFIPEIAKRHFSDMKTGYVFFMKTFAPDKTNILSLLIFNISAPSLALSLIYSEMKEKSKTQVFGLFLILSCPLIISNVTILMREGWVLLFGLLLFTGAYSRKLTWIITGFSGCLLIRPEVVLLFLICFTAYEFGRFLKLDFLTKCFMSLSACMILGFIGFYFEFTIAGREIYRSIDLKNFISVGTYSAIRDTIFGVLLGPVIYVLSPFPSLDGIGNGVRPFLLYFGNFFWCIIAYLWVIKNLPMCLRSQNSKFLLFSAIVSMTVLTYSSTQSRHKIPFLIFPLAATVGIVERRT